MLHGGRPLSVLRVGDGTIEHHRRRTSAETRCRGRHAADAPVRFPSLLASDRLRMMRKRREGAPLSTLSPNDAGRIIGQRSRISPICRARFLTRTTVRNYDTMMRARGDGVLAETPYGAAAVRCPKGLQMHYPHQGPTIINDGAWRHACTQQFHLREMGPVSHGTPLPKLFHSDDQHPFRLFRRQARARQRAARRFTGLQRLCYGPAAPVP